MMPKERAVAIIILLGCRGLCNSQEQQNTTNIPIFATKAVKGMPFSAKVITESSQPFVDGNRIMRTNVAFIARDSEGRTRREQVLPRVGTASAASASIVFIQDPTSATAYVLEPQSRLAGKWSIRSAGRVAKPPEINGPTGRAEPTNIRTESLGMQVVEGIVAAGTRITRTLAPGEAGNERAMDIISEAWYSTELQTLIMSKTTDPRLGEITYRLTEIQRGEPLHSLFEIPADYTIREDQQTATLEKSGSR